MSATQKQTGPPPGGAADPNPALAALFTWLIPGGGHFYLGKVRTAAVAFVVIQGLYLAGVLASKGMFMLILPPEMQGRFAVALTPEAGNLGALLLHARQYGFGDGTPHPFPSGIHIGVMLTATSGILNLLLASRAHFEARAMKSATIEGAAKDPLPCVVLGWLFPGAGHIAQGRVARGLVAATLLIGLFVLGTALADGTNLDRTRHFYYWAGQAFLGPVAFIAELINGHPRMTERIEYADAGVVLSSIAGMLNVMLLLDVYGYSDAKLFGRPIATDHAEPEETISIASEVPRSPESARAKGATP